MAIYSAYGMPVEVTEVISPTVVKIIYPDGQQGEVPLNSLQDDSNGEELQTVMQQTSDSE